MKNFHCLYSFTSPDLALLEIKRTDQPEGTPLNDVYKWLILSLCEGQVFEFEFKSINRSAEEEQRGFAHAKLVFNKKMATLELFNKKLSFISENPEEVSSEKLALVSQYLQSEKQKVSKSVLDMIKNEKT